MDAKSPANYRGAGESREIPRLHSPSYSISAVLGGARRRLGDCVRHRAPDVSGEDRSWLRSVASGDDDADWLRRAGLFTILFHADSQLVGASLPFGGIIGTPCAALDACRK